jgi:3-hydroxy-9,10-secoandrosta-1,3,5(10)-triene-9,17-dione monooxygenase reductase component
MKSISTVGADTMSTSTSYVTASPEASIAPDNFRKVMSRYPTGIVAVTSMIDEKPVAMIVGSFSSVSLAPPLVSFVAGHGSASYQKLRNADRFVINVLGSGQAGVCQSLSSKSVVDRWAGIDWTPSSFGHPLIADCVAHIECKAYAVHAAGDHDIVIGTVERMAGNGDGHPLVFFGGGFHRLGTI